MQTFCGSSIRRICFFLIPSFRIEESASVDNIGFLISYLFENLEGLAHARIQPG